MSCQMFQYVLALYVVKNPLLLERKQKSCVKGAPEQRVTLLCHRVIVFHMVELNKLGLQPYIPPALSYMQRGDAP